MKTQLTFIALVCLALCAGCNAEREIFPGIDFPLEWLPDSTPGMDEMIVLAESRANFEKAKQRHAFHTWVNQNNFSFASHEIDAFIEFGELKKRTKDQKDCLEKVFEMSIENERLKQELQKAIAKHDVSDTMR